MRITIIKKADFSAIDAKQVEDLVIAALAFKEIYTDEVIIHFVSKKEISILHGRYFQDPSPTDCITFPIDSPLDKDPSGKNVDATTPSILGEVFVCPEVAVEYDPENPLDEISLYIVHGLLHLLGFDDQTDAEEKMMRLLESELIDHLKEKNLLLSNSDPAIQNKYDN